jgi:hypothetical protein
VLRTVSPWVTTAKVRPRHQSSPRCHKVSSHRAFRYQGCIGLLQSCSYAKMRH